MPSDPFDLQRFIAAQPWFAGLPAAMQERLREEVFAEQEIGRAHV